MFVDNIRIFARAGKGGNGLVSFRRAKFVPKGGPDGGDGGDGGSVILEVDPHTNDLRSFFYDPKLIATDGVGGQSAKKHGKNGKSVIGKVPPGTIIYRSNASSMAEATWLEREGEGIELEKIADLTEIGTRFTLCQGGLGGKGNWHFRSATNQAPTEAEMGTEGEEGVFFMELRRIADAGLVGYPNAGKSTLLGDISEAKPKVASYPFTTLQPIIGVVEFDSFRRCIVADIPGIIEGASEGAGLGHDFLRHIDRCRLLIHVVDVSGCEGRDPVEDFKAIQEELKQYGPDLASRPMIVAGNKVDIAADRTGLEALKAYVEGLGMPFYEISAAAQLGTRELMFAAARELEHLPPITVYEPTYVERPPEVDTSGEVSIEKYDDTWVVEAPWLQQLIASVNFGDFESRNWFDKNLRQSGLFDRLEAMGIQDGDIVSMYDLEFEYQR